MAPWFAAAGLRAECTARSGAAPPCLSSSIRRRAARLRGPSAGWRALARLRWPTPCRLWRSTSPSGSSWCGERMALTPGPYVLAQGAISALGQAGRKHAIARIRRPRQPTWSSRSCASARRRSGSTCRRAAMASSASPRTAATASSTGRPAFDFGSAAFSSFTARHRGRSHRGRRFRAGTAHSGEVLQALRRPTC